MLKKIRQYWHIIIGVLIVFISWFASYLIWYYTHRPTLLIAPLELERTSRTFWDFTNQYGAFLGIAFTILVGVLTALIPSRVEEIAERLQSPLENFQEIYEKALELLIWAGDQPFSRFIMTSATPIFGIELNDESRRRWEAVLRRRIVAAQENGAVTTELICLDPDSEDGLGQSPLWRFCKELESNGLLKTFATEGAAGILYQRSMAAFTEFAKLYEKSPNFKLLCGPPPPLHFVLASNHHGEKKAILYFTGIESSKGLVVSGFSTTDDRWLGLVDVVNQYLQNEGWDALSAFKGDTRTPAQRERCAKLLEYQLKRRKEYDQEIGKYKIKVYPDVFPPEFALGTTSLLEAIEAVGNLFKTKFSGRNIFGLDVGTGTGILSLALAEYCNQVYAVDISTAAVKNAQHNTRHINHIRVFHSDLLEVVPRIPEGNMTVIVFNYPFYPSPLAVYNSSDRSKARAGLQIVREMFEQLDNIIPGPSVLLMPYHTIAEGHDPATVARQNGYKIISTPPGAETIVYAFTKNPEINNAIGDTLSPRPSNP